MGTEPKPSQKPGWKTTEFWLSTVATVVGLALASGAVPETGTPATIAGAVVAILAALGYTVTRGGVKKAAEKTPPKEEA